MALTVKYVGWKHFADSGHPFREWTFCEDVPELKATKGDRLLDHGPHDRDAESRFDVRDGATSKTDGRRFSLEQVEEAVGLTLPPWRPPREADLLITKSLNAVTDAMKEVGKAIDRADANRRALQDVQKVLDDTRKKASESKPTLQNKYLRLKGDYQYNNGEPYRDWELLVDVPEIPVTRTQGADPMHAAKGDVIREDEDDDLTPFELRRNGSRIGDPEWWLISWLFHGLKEGAPEEPESEPSPLARERTRARKAIEGGSPFGVYRVERDLGVLDIQVGDVLVYADGPDRFPTMRGTVRYLSLDDYQTLADVRYGPGPGRFVHETFVDLVPGNTYYTLAEFLTDKRKWGMRLKVWHSRLAVVRPPWEHLTEPIEAISDDAALFELLAQVGGRMPVEA